MADSNEYVGIEGNQVAAPDITQAPLPSLLPPEALAPREVANPYVGIEGTEGQAATKMSLFQAEKIEPDRAAKVLGLSNQYGVAPDLADRQFDEMSREANAPDLSKLSKMSPALTKLMNDPYRAAAIKDDLDAQTQVEGTVKESSLYMTAMHALDQGLSMAESQLAHVPGLGADVLTAGLNIQQHLVNMINEATGSSVKRPMLRTPRFMHDNAVTRHYDAEVERASALSPEASQSTIDEMMKGNYGKAGRTAFYSLVANAPNLAVMMALGSQGLAAEVAGYAALTTAAGAAGENAQQIRDQEAVPELLRDPSAPHINPDLATGGALAKGAAEALFEHVGTYLPLKAWENAVFNAGGRAAIRETVVDFSKTMLRTIFSNAAEEALTQGAQDLTDYYTGVNPEALNGIGMRMADAGLIGGATGATLVAPTGVMSGLARRAQAAHQAARAQGATDYITNLAAQTAATKTQARSPDLQAQIISEAVAGTDQQDVLVAVEDVEKYFQGKDENPTAVMQRLGVLPEYGAAKETGGDVKIPLAKFLDLVNEGHPELAADAKFSADALSLNQTKALEAETAAAVKSADAQATATEEVPALNARGLTPAQQRAESLATVNQNITEQLKAAGRSPEEAKILMATFATTAERAGIDVLDLYKDMNLTVRGGESVEQSGRRTPGETVLRQDQVDTLAPSADDTPELADAKALLSQIDTAKKATALRGKARTRYLMALDEVYGDREARAKGMGFSDDVVFHGTAQEFDQFRAGGASADGTYFTNNEDLARDYADDAEANAYTADEKARVIEARLRNPNPLTVQDDGQYAWGAGHDQLIEQARAAGNTSVVLEQTVDNISDDYRDPATNTIALDPSQIRDVDAAFDPRFSDSPLLLAQSDAYLAPATYSKLIRTIEEKMPNAAPPDQVRAIVRDIKAEEKKWMGLDEFLDGKAKVTKAEVLDFLRANQLQIEEVTKGFERPSYEITRDGGGSYFIDGLDGEFNTYEAAAEYLKEEVDANDQTSTKYSDYTLPGGENYREVLFKLPDADQDLENRRLRAKAELATANRKVTRATAKVIDEGGHWQGAAQTAVERGYITQEDIDTAARLDAKFQEVQEERGQNYKSSHWDEANILAFTRLNDRVDADGKRVLMVEEVQSDWHQDGRKKGYRGDELPNGMRVEAEPNKTLGEFRVVDREGALVAHGDTEAAAIANVGGSGRGQVPDAPFRKTWHEFALKKIIRMAAEGGYDRIAWTTGEQQGERYNIAKKVREIEYEVNDDGTYTLGITGHDGEGVPLPKDRYTGDELEGVIGKEVATKIVNGEGKKYRGHTGRTLEGLDLKVGGEGMKGFYDKIVPDYLRKFGKKYGATVGEASFDVETLQRGSNNQYHVEEFESRNGIRYLVYDQNNNDVDSYGTREGAQAAADQLNSGGGQRAIVHAMDITPALRDAALNQGFELFQNGEETTPRGLISISDGRINIDLLKQANASTLIHESGHFIVEMMRRLSLREDVPDQIKNDFRKLMAHAGNTGEDITVEQHETLARSFEAYVMEGKAPSRALRGAFSRMMQWMIGIYKNITGLNVQLTDDVRGVFDRILATDAEIEAASGKMIAEPLFLEPAKYGLSPDQHAEYQSAIDAAKLSANDELRAKVMKDITKEKTGRWKEQHARVTDEVTAAVNAEPVYRAMQALQTGKTVDGLPVDTFGLDRLKIDRAAVIAEYGEAAAKELPRATTSRENGLHPDQIAPMFGFESGSELIEALRAAEKKSDVIARGVDQAMQQISPDLLGTQEMADAAMVAIHNEKRAAVLKLEMKYALEQNPGVVRKITERATKKMPTDKAIRASVERILGQKKIGDIKPNEYRVAERKARADAGKALAAGDYDAVFESKRRELINFELFNAATEARDSVKDDLKFFRRLTKPDEAVSKTRDGNLVQTARAILAAYGIGRDETSPAEHLAKLKTYDPDGFAAATYHVEAATLGRSANYNEVSYDDYVAMRESVKALWDLARTTKEIEIEGRKMQSEQVRGELIGQIQSIAPAQKAEYTRTQNGWDRAKSSVRGFKADLIRVEGWAQAMDVNGIGAFTSYIFRPVSEAVTRYRVEKIERLQALEKLYRDNERIFTKQKIMAEELGPNGHQFKDKSELLMALLHSGNDSNLRKLLVGRQWGTVAEDGTLDRTAFDRFITRMQAEGVLTKADYDFVQGVWDLNEQLKPGAQKAHKTMLGYYFNEITADEVVTPFGVYRGGYIPAKLDLDMSETAKVRAEKEAFENNNNSYQFPTTGRGFTKSRVDQFAGPLSLNMNLLSGHIDQVLRFTHIEPRVKEVARLVTNEELREQLKVIDANIASDALIPWLQRAATQKIVMPSQTGIGRATDRMAAYLRTGVSGNILVGNLTNGLQQLTGYFVAASKVPPKKLAEAMVIYYRNPKKTVADICEMSPWMRTTQESTIIEVTQAMDQILTDPTVFDSMKKFAGRHGQFLQGFFQNMVNPVVWLGAYNDAIEKGSSHEDAVFLGDSAVRTTQGTQNAEDISRFETGTQTERMFKYFASYFNLTANLNANELTRISRDVGLKKGAGRAFYLYTMAIMAPAVLAELITQGMGGHVGPDDDEDWAYYALRTYFGSQIRLMTAMVPVVGPLASAAYGQFTKQQYDDRLSLSPVISLLEAGIAVPNELYQNVVNKAHNERKLTRDALGLLGVLTQLPLQPLAKPINYYRDVQDRKIRPSNAFDYARGLVTGKGERR